MAARVGVGMGILQASNPAEFWKLQELKISSVLFLYF
jgi:hypothetical protein